ncbi:MAG: 4Fe-4S binding protein [Deltaproteobacteria bacterium]|nr:4Fe-4S binding protein [Deltaproteobacteria bacterium]
MKMWRKPLDLREKSLPPAEIHIIESRCKGCGLCVEFCPRGVLKMSDKFNSACVGCHFCEEVCPEFAIFCSNSPDK